MDALPKRLGVSFVRSCCFVFVMGLLPALTSSCSNLPGFGPYRSDIYDSTGQKDDDQKDLNPLGFRIVDLDPKVIAAAKADAPSLSDPFLKLTRPQPVDTVVPGDVLSISIFEAGPGLFATGNTQNSGGTDNAINAAPSGSAGSVTIPRVTVTRDGTISLPYVGRLSVSGLTTSNIGAAILQNLIGKASQPQVLVERVVEVGNKVVVMGDVHKPGRYPLSLAHEHLLDVVAEAEGPTHPDRETSITLIRHGQKATEMLITLAQDPQSDPVLEPGDRIELRYEPKTYLVFGAAGRPSEIPFETERVTLAQGIARAGGLQDFQADPRGVFVFRMEQTQIASGLGLSTTAGIPAVPLIYRVNLTAPATYFLMQNFQLMDKDLVYVSDAPVMNFEKIVGVLNGLFTPLATTRAVAQ